MTQKILIRILKTPLVHFSTVSSFFAYSTQKLSSEFLPKMDSSKREASRKKVWEDDVRRDEKPTKKDKDKSKKNKDDRDSSSGRDRSDEDHKTKKRREPEKDEKKTKEKDVKKLKHDEKDAKKVKHDEKEKDTKKVKFDEKKHREPEKKTISEVIKLPRELSKAETTFRITVSNGEAKLVHSSGDYISKQAIDYCMNKHVFERPIWPSKRDSTTKNPDVGALIARWVKKTSSEKKNSTDEEKGRKKVFIKFSDVGEETQKKILMDLD